MGNLSDGLLKSSFKDWWQFFLLNYKFVKYFIDHVLHVQDERNEFSKEIVNFLILLDRSQDLTIFINKQFWVSSFGRKTAKLVLTADSLD